MATKSYNAPSAEAASSTQRPDCGLAARTRTQAPNHHHNITVARRQRVLALAAWLSLMVDTSFIGVQIIIKGALWETVWINLVAAAAFAIVPLLQRFGELLAPLTFIGVTYTAVFVDCWIMGTGTGAQSFYLVEVCLVVLLLGIERIILAAVLAAVAAGLMIALEVLVPHSTGAEPMWITTGFALTTISGCAVVVATVWYSLRETAQAETIMEAEYERSEALLANMLPVSIADRLKDPERNVIADKYDDTSILFADIAGFTERASETSPTELIQFLDRTYTEFDALVDKYALEKIKVSGDSYMVVSGVPRPRPDHLEALAYLALDMADAAAKLADPLGQNLPLRIGMATGPVVAGVVGSRRFFYDVWGDAVNIASRMETTGAVGRIHVPETVYQRLKDNFVLEERGTVNVKGKGFMHTWYLVGRKPETGSGDLRAEAAQAAGV